MNGTPFRLAIVTSHPIQYQSPWFRLLAAHPDIALTVFFCCDHGQKPSYDAEFATTFAWERALTEGFDHEVLTSLHPRPAPYGFFRLTNPGLWTRLTRARFDAVMPVGWGFASTWLAVAAARAHGVRVLLRAESHDGSPSPRSAPKRAARRAVLTTLFAQVDAFLAIGTRNAELYRSYGVPDERIFLTPYAVDNAFFLVEAERWAPRRDEVRRQLGVTGEQPVVLASGKLTERKAPLDLLRAFARTRRSTPSKLVFAGDGPLRPAVEALARREGVADDVVITGFVQQSELSGLYTAADLFVFPTRFETWGLVLNEAMLFGLPVICTTEVPAHVDLVTPGENGDVYPVGDVDALAGLLQARLADPARLKQMGAKGRARVEDWNLDRCVEGMLAALRASIAST